jgi:hypothetical protein
LQKLTRFLLGSALVLGLAVVAKSAHADTINTDYFKVTDGATSNVFTFTLPESPTPTGVGSNDFWITNVPVWINGTTLVDESVYFIKLATGGLGIQIPGGFFFDEGPQLFTGSLSNPTFLPGTYTVYDDSAPQNPSHNGTVEISPVPEPNTLALIGTGVLGVAGAIRRRFTV